MKKVILMLACLAVSSLTACAATGKGGAGDTGTAMCLMQDDQPAKVYMEYEGKDVGFCCKKCMGAFEKMTPEQKAEKLAAQMK